LTGAWTLIKPLAPETAMRFHYWQPAPRWDCSHGVPTQKGEKMGTCDTDKTVEREGGKRGKQSLRRAPMLKKILTL